MDKSFSTRHTETHVNCIGGDSAGLDSDTADPVTSKKKYPAKNAQLLLSDRVECRY